MADHVNLVVKGLARAVSMCSDNADLRSFNAADFKLLLRTVTQALQVTAAKLPQEEHRKAVLDAAEKYLQLAISLMSAIDQCNAEYLPSRLALQC